MRRVAKCLLVFLFAPAFSQAAQDGFSERLMEVAFTFQLCARDKADREIASVRKSPVQKKSSTEISEIEGRIWGKVLDSCGEHLGDKAKGLIFLHYDGNNPKSIGFFEGVVYSARAYVVSEVLEAFPRKP